MTVHRVNRALLSATMLFCAATLSSCDYYYQFFFPCETLNPNTAKGRQRYMDGTWYLESVNGTPFKGNYLLIDGSKLTNASMDFHTLRLDEGKCDSPENSGGEVLASYTVTKGNDAKPKKVVSGGFEHHDRTGTVTLRALGYTASGFATLAVVDGESGIFVSDASKFTIAAKIPIGGDVVDLGSITYNLVFYRSQNLR